MKTWALLIVALALFAMTAGCTVSGAGNGRSDYRSDYGNPYGGHGGHAH